MASNYIPAADPMFELWQANFVTYLSANFAALGLDAGDVTPVTGSQTIWDGAFGALAPARAAAAAATQAKEQARDGFETVIREVVRRIQSNPAVTNEQRALLGITVPDGTPSPTGAPGTFPTCVIETCDRLRHTIDFRDSATPNKRAKPPGTMGCEIYVKTAAVGDPVPSDPAMFTFLALDTATPYVADFPGSEGGKNAHYRLRWVSTRGDKGPWSEVFSATIGV